LRLQIIFFWFLEEKRKKENITNTHTQTHNLSLSWGTLVSKYSIKKRKTFWFFFFVLFFFFSFIFYKKINKKREKQFIK
jgi:hypothetical protein